MIKKSNNTLSATLSILVFYFLRIGFFAVASFATGLAMWFLPQGWLGLRSFLGVYGIPFSVPSAGIYAVLRFVLAVAGGMVWWYGDKAIHRIQFTHQGQESQGDMAGDVWALAESPSDSSHQVKNRLASQGLKQYGTNSYCRLGLQLQAAQSAGCQSYALDRGAPLSLANNPRALVMRSDSSIGSDLGSPLYKITTDQKGVRESLGALESFLQRMDLVPDSRAALMQLWSDNLSLPKQLAGVWCKQGTVSHQHILRGFTVYGPACPDPLPQATAYAKAVVEVSSPVVQKFFANKNVEERQEELLREDAKGSEDTSSSSYFANMVSVSPISSFQMSSFLHGLKVAARNLETMLAGESPVKRAYVGRSVGSAQWEGSQSLNQEYFDGSLSTDDASVLTSILGSPDEKGVLGYNNGWLSSDQLGLQEGVSPEQLGLSGGVSYDSPWSERGEGGDYSREIPTDEIWRFLNEDDGSDSRDGEDVRELSLGEFERFMNGEQDDSILSIVGGQDESIPLIEGKYRILSSSSRRLFADPVKYPVSPEELGGYLSQMEATGDRGDVWGATGEEGALPQEDVAGLEDEMDPNLDEMSTESLINHLGDLSRDLGKQNGLFSRT